MTHTEQAERAHAYWLRRHAAMAEHDTPERVQAEILARLALISLVNESGLAWSRWDPRML